MSSSPSPSILTNERLNAKLAEFDRLAEASFDDLLRFMQENRAGLIALAKGRLVTGHYVYGDRLMYEYEPSRLDKERAEEIADAVNYTYCRITKLEPDPVQRTIRDLDAVRRSQLAT